MKNVQVLIAVGSANPNKVRGVTRAAKRLFGVGGSGRAKVIGIDVESGVSGQPYGKETLRGAVNRAKAVARKPRAKGANYFVGLESGIFELGGRYFDVQWCAVIPRGKSGERAHLGCSMGFEIPQKEAEMLMKHKITLSELYYKITGDKDIGKKEGVIGHLSNGLLKRSEMTEQAFLCAMIPLMKKISSKP